MRSVRADRPRVVDTLAALATAVGGTLSAIAIVLGGCAGFDPTPRATATPTSPRSATPPMPR